MEAWYLMVARGKRLGFGPNILPRGAEDGMRGKVARCIQQSRGRDSPIEDDPDYFRHLVVEARRHTLRWSSTEHGKGSNHHLCVHQRSFAESGAGAISFRHHPGRPACITVNRRYDRSPGCLGTFLTVAARPCCIPAESNSYRKGSAILWRVRCGSTGNWTASRKGLPFERYRQRQRRLGRRWPGGSIRAARIRTSDTSLAMVSFRE